MIQTMLDAGVHVGHRIQRWNPAMSQYIHGQNYGIHIINIFETYVYLRKACQFLGSRKKKRVLFVGTKKSASYLIKIAASCCDKQAHYINHRWLGGFLTNWTTMRECISKLNTIDPEKAVSKKERLLLIKHKTRLDKFFCGVQTMQLKPELLIIVGQQEELIAVNESRKLNIPNITIVDTNCNPNLATYFIPGNDDSFFSIQLLLKILVNAYNTTFEEVFPFDEN